MRWLLIFNFLLKISLQNEINTAQGRLRGEENDGFVSYNGIPYGMVKDGDAKFKRAGLAPQWTGTRDSKRSTCTLSDEEDCMELDVHVPKTGGEMWPVLMWVAGGGVQYHPGRLVTQGIIVVIVHHRLGPLGFLCTKEEQIPGNAGAKDIVSALRWVRDNIAAFRGNPAHVVVGGQGFGAAIVEGLMLSPMTEGLYHGAIMQSGTGLSPWAFNYDAGERARALGQMYSDSEAVPYSMQKADDMDLADKAEDLNLPYFPFAMCVEKPFKKAERFLSEPPFDMLSNGKVRRVPLIIGFNSEEGYVFAGLLNRVQILRKMAEDFRILIPDEIKNLSDRELTKIQEMYFEGKVNMSAVVAYHSDVYFVNHVHRSARLHASASELPVYYYQYSHLSDSGVEEVNGLPKRGAAHSDELALLFPDKGRELDGEDGEVQRNLIGLWTNFVKYLDPSAPGEQVVWAAADAHRPRLLDIGTQLSMSEFPRERACRLWDEVYERHYYNKLRNTV